MDVVDNRDGVYGSPLTSEASFLGVIHCRPI